MSKEFDRDAAKHIVLKTCKTADMALLEPKNRFHLIPVNHACFPYQIHSQGPVVLCHLYKLAVVHSV